MTVAGRKIVLAASDSESSEYLRSTWRQMLLATLPARYAKYMGADWSSTNDVASDGQAKYVPNGLRVVEALLLKDFPAEEIAVCYADQLDRFVGDETRVVGIHAHTRLALPLRPTSTPDFTGGSASQSMPPSFDA